MPKRKIHWTKKATQQFNEAINYIRLDSDKRADKVKNTLLEKITKLSDDSIVHRIDPYKLNNDGRYLYFEVLKYRIVYYAGQKEVFIEEEELLDQAPRRRDWESRRCGDECD